MEIIDFLYMHMEGKTVEELKAIHLEPVGDPVSYSYTKRVHKNTVTRTTRARWFRMVLA